MSHARLALKRASLPDCSMHRLFQTTRLLPAAQLTRARRTAQRQQQVSRGCEKLWRVEPAGLQQPLMRACVCPWAAAIARNLQHNEMPSTDGINHSNRRQTRQAGRQACRQAGRPDQVRVWLRDAHLPPFNASCSSSRLFW